VRLGQLYLHCASLAQLSSLRVINALRYVTRFFFICCSLITRQIYIHSDLWRFNNDQNNENISSGKCFRGRFSTVIKKGDVHTEDTFFLHDSITPERKTDDVVNFCLPSQLNKFSAQLPTGSAAGKQGTWDEGTNEAEYNFLSTFPQG
jgi:hypothetical protein